MNRIIVAGGRDYNDVDGMTTHLHRRFFTADSVTILSGGARGADRCGEEVARRFNWNLEVYEADWETHGKGAGFIRNKQMADKATHLVAFWDGKRRGTKHMINTAREMGLNVEVVGYSANQGER